ncbi:MAG: hypothetical protein AABX10_00230 [Nanoarchaeota archaeon]
MIKYTAEQMLDAINAYSEITAALTTMQRHLIEDDETGIATNTVRGYYSRLMVCLEKIPPELHARLPNINGLDNLIKRLMLH